MKTEAIIAVRGELRGNLEKTINQLVDRVGVCLVFDGAEKGNEPWPELKRNGVRIEQPWREPRGCGQARHHGITTSSAENIILCDGHMEIPWAAILATMKHLKRHDRQVTCAAMYGLTPKWERIPKVDYSGAFLAVKTTEPQVDIAGPRAEYFALSAKWNIDNKKSGVIGAPMGAFYGFRREFYERMGQPLSILEAWGGDEELLALCSWVCGDGTYLIPAAVGHIMAAPHVNRMIYPAGRWANRICVAEALPWEEPRGELTAWMRKTAVAWRVIDGIITDERLDKVLALQMHLRSFGKTWEDFTKDLVRPWTYEKERAAVAPPQVLPPSIPTRPQVYTPPPAPPDDVTQIITRPRERCAKCLHTNTFRHTRGPRGTGPMQIVMARCRICGHRAQIRIV